MIVFALWPSTTLASYTFAGMSHVADFMGCSVFLLSWWRTKDSDSTVSWLICGLSCGLMTLVRWQSAPFVSIPATYELMQFRQALRRDGNWLRSRLLGAVTTFIILITQFKEWHTIYGSYLVIPQGSGFLQFPPRDTFNVLFSSRHGWFVWTPVVTLGIGGLIYCIRRQRLVSVALLIGIALQVLVCASMPTNWHGGGSFGIRMLTNCVPAVAVGVMLLALSTSRKAVIVFSGFGLFCIVYSLLFAVQYRLDLIPKDDRLTVRELLVDKVGIKSAIARHQEYLGVRDSLEAGKVSRAAVMGAAAQRQYPDDRMLQDLVDQIRRKQIDVTYPTEPNTEPRSILDYLLW